MPPRIRCGAFAARRPAQAPSRPRLTSPFSVARSALPAARSGSAAAAAAAAKTVPWQILGALSGAAIALTLWELKPESRPSLFETVHAEVPPAENVYIDPTTSTPFPTTIPARGASRGGDLRLVGTGVRTVSFLSIRVYAVAFYVSSDVLDKVKAGKVKGFENYSAEQLIPPYAPDAAERGVVTGEALVDNLIDTQADFAVVIVPLRNTTLPHMRDGFARAVLARLKLPSLASTLTPEESEEAMNQITEMKSFFPSKTLAKGDALTVYFATAPGPSTSRRTVEFSTDKPQRVVLGALPSPLIARQMILSYLAPDKGGVISEELRQSVARGLAGEPR